MDGDNFKSKHRGKRSVALVSFAAILFVLIAVLAAVYFGDAGVADRLRAASPIIIAILLFLTGLVGAWLGLTHHDDLISGARNAVDGG